jgi:Domain of unknown function (DUF1835)
MLHVVNGDAAMALLAQSPVEGKFLVWKDMLMEGPIPSDGGPIDLKARAAFLGAKYGADAKTYRAGMQALFAALARAAKGNDEVVLWFEEDFFCQIHLVYLLAHLPGPLRKKGRVSVICPDKPLGARLPAAFPRLLANRLPLERGLLTLAGKVWKAYAADSIAGWESFLEWARSGDGFAPWPALRAGLRAHLGRLPTAHGGPNALETALLRSLAAGPSDFPHYARRVWSEPMIKPLGLGDLQIARYVLDLSELPRPLIAIEGKRPAPGRAPDPAPWKLRLTEAGMVRLQEAIAGPIPDAVPERNRKVTPGAPRAKAGPGRARKNRAVPGRKATKPRAKTGRARKRP